MYTYMVNLEINSVIPLLFIGGHVKGQQLYFHELTHLFSLWYILVIFIKKKKKKWYILVIYIIIELLLTKRKQLQAKNFKKGLDLLSRVRFALKNFLIWAPRTFHKDNNEHCTLGCLFLSHKEKFLAYVSVLAWCYLQLDYFII